MTKKNVTYVKAPKSNNTSIYNQTLRKVRRRIRALNDKIGTTAVVSNFLFRYENIGGLPNERAATERGIEDSVLRDMQQFLSKPTTVTAYKKARAEKIRIFHEHGYNKINEDNLEEAVAALEAMRDSLAVINSQQMLDAIDDPAQFDAYIAKIAYMATDDPTENYISLLDGYGKEVKFNADTI